MKIKNIFSDIGLILVMGVTLTACTQEEQNSFGDKSYKTENGFYVYPVDFQCSISDYDEGGKTRSMNYEWDNMTTLFARFNSGSTNYYGFMTYENSRWQLVSTTDFLELTTSGIIELYYFRESNGDNYYYNLKTACFDIYNKGSLVKNTSLPWNNKSFDLSEGTAVYFTESGTYSFTASNGIFTVKATLDPGMWRMRFSGTNGTTITMPAADNDIQYLTSFNWYEAEDYLFYGDFKDISLQVSNNYTPYIYGIFNSTTSNKITVKNGSDTFTRNLSSSNLPAGISGCFTIPTSSNYSSMGWTMVDKGVQMSLKDMLEKPMGTVNIDMKTESYQTIRDEVAKSYTIADNTYEGQSWFSLSIDDNASCNDWRYQGLPFNNFNIFKYDDGISLSYYFRVEKSKASNNYASYLNKIIQDFKNLNISLEDNGSTSVYLAQYIGYDAAKNRYAVSVSDYNTDKYEFYIYARYKYATNLSVSKTLLNFTESGGSQTITVASNESWTATSNQSWCTVSPSSGSNDSTITITVAANSSSARTAKVTVKGSTSGDSVEVSVSQDAGSDISRDEYGNDKEL